MIAVALPSVPIITRAASDDLVPWFAAPEALQQWAKGARAGDQFRYALAPRLPTICPVRGPARALYDDGMIIMAHRPRPRGKAYDYLAIRTAAPWPQMMSEKAREEALMRVGTSARAMFAMLEACANAGEPCPADYQTRIALGILPHMIRVARVELLTFGLIRSETWANAIGGQWRVIIITSTGARTAPPPAHFSRRVI